MAGIITIIMTPWTNSDSLIIPKLITLFCLASSLLPFLIILKRFLLNSFLGKSITLISFLIIIHLVLVLFLSKSPLEQSFFGRTGRGLGFVTEFSLIIIFLMSIATVTQKSIKTLQLVILIACLVTSTYSVLQRFGLDIFDWTTRTNGIIGTLGNPNFQSSFASMVLIFSGIYFWDKKWGKILSLAVSIPLLVLIYISESTQGYITTLSSFSIFGLIYFWYRNKKIFTGSLLFFLTSALVALMGMLNKGPLAEILYKISVQSRGNFFRTSVRIANENPIFGVGLDSLGDNYLKFIDSRTAASIGEFTDNSHNLFLNYAVSGGYILALLQYSLAIFVLYSFFKIQKEFKVFQPLNTALFCSWVCYQLQALISPANISMLTWNAIISGSIIGIYLKQVKSLNVEKDISREKILLVRPFAYLLFILGFVILYPLYKVDHMQVVANKTGNANLAIQSALSYPESTIRYSRIGQDLLKSNLLPQALELGRSAVKFNPNAPSAWGLILINPAAPLTERLTAKNEILKLDPFNKDLKNYNLPNSLNQ
jgi:hypothetical protein